MKNQKLKFIHKNFIYAYVNFKWLWNATKLENSVDDLTELVNKVKKMICSMQLIHWYYHEESDEQ